MLRCAFCNTELESVELADGETITVNRRPWLVVDVNARWPYRDDQTIITPSGGFYRGGVVATAANRYYAERLAGDDGYEIGRIIHSPASPACPATIEPECDNEQYLQIQALRRVSRLAKYRKKPVVIEAMQFTGESKDRVMAWLRYDASPTFNAEGAPTLTILTLEGAMTAQIGDYVIRGVKGEFYPCKPDIFEQTYEPVD